MDLAISSLIMKAMSGQLAFHNRADGGTEFVVRLPLTAEENGD
ncbi:MAG TPA: ATP-binding protein [Burkholderiaceae bacterium]|nr:ATP-binding protein [Burkholderiaceae bacterium]